MIINKYYISLICLLILCTLVYWPGLSGGFLFDDFPNIVHNHKLTSITTLSIDSIHSAISQYEQGPIGRSISFISFAINHALTGLEPFYFKLTNLLIHLLSGVILFFLLKTLLKCIEQYKRLNYQLLSLAVTAAWLLHPFNITTVLYVVQRMAGLSTFFILIALLFYALGRLKLIQGKKGASYYFIAMFIPFFLGLFSKENGILFFAYLFVIEVFLLRFQAKEHRSSQWLKKIYLMLVIIGLPVFIYMMFKISYNAYGHRDFTLTERLLTESRVLWFYIQSILLPDITKMTIFHDDFSISRSLIDPLSTLFSLIGILLLLAIALYIRKKEPIISFGLFLFFSAHLMESTTIPLELIHEHRNYFASIGLLLILFYVFFRLTYYTQYKKTIAGFIILFISFLALNTFVRAGYWSSDLLLTRYHANHHPESYRSMISAGGSFSTHGDFNNSFIYKVNGLEYYKKAYQLKPKSSIALFSIISIHLSLKQPEKNTEYIEKLLYNLKNKPVNSDVLNAMLGTKDCLLKKGCFFPLKLFKQIAETLLKNPTLINQQDLAMIYSINSNLAWLENNLELAIEYNLKAVNYFPQDSSHAINQASLLTIKGNFKDAEKYLKIAEENDNSSYTAKLLKQQRAYIKQLDIQSSHEERLIINQGQ